MLTQTSDVIFENESTKKQANQKIHLHLDKQTEDHRNDFSPFSLHLASGGKDSLNVLSRRSREKNSDLNNSPDDGICTIRADSHLEGAAKMIKF